MSAQPLKVISVNVHRSNNRTHTLLQSSNADLILIQELWFHTVATLHSNTDPLGTAQTGAPLNNMWETLTPKLPPDATCKAIGYAHKALAQSGVIQNNTGHPLSTPNSLVIEIDLQDGTKITVINTYHAVPTWGGHDLHYLLQYEINELTPTVLIGDFNTHAHRWSLPGQAPSSWGVELKKWLNQNGLQVMNPDGVPTWVGLREGN
jgi:endonuclease/exonuclease/phosphatase family metal-dependent hydrolase